MWFLKIGPDLPRTTIIVEGIYILTQDKLIEKFFLLIYIVNGLVYNIKKSLPRLDTPIVQKISKLYIFHLRPNLYKL